MSTKLRALIVEDSEADASLLARELERAGYDLAYKRVQTAKDLADALAGESWDIVFADYTMPRFKGTQALNLLNESGLDIPFIFVSGTIGEATAVEAMRHGAKDYIVKGNLHRLGPVVERELRDALVRRERTRAEEALRESEQRYHLLASASPVGIYHTDAKGDCLYVNKRWCEIAGLAPEQARGEGWAQALHPDDREKVSKEWQRAARDKLPFTAEYRFKRPDGVTTWVFGQAVGVLEAGGEVKGYVGTITDVTEAKHAVEALQARYQELQMLQGISQAVLSSLDLKAIVEGILEKAMSIGSFDLGAIRLVDPQTRLLNPVSARGYRNPTEVTPHSLDPRDPTFGTRQAEIFAEKKPFVVEQVSASKGLQTLKKEGAESAIYIPVTAENEALGTIQLASRKPRKFSASEIHLLGAIGNQLGIAVQKARLYEETQRQLQALKLLVAGARGLTANLDVTTLAKDVLATVANSFGFPLAWIGRAEPDGLVRPLHWAGEVGDYLSNVEIRWDDSPVGQGRSGRAIRARSSVVMDIVQDPALAPWREAALAKGYRSIAAFPLIAGEKPFGVLVLYSHEPDFFTQERVELIQSYSYIAAGALENARLLEETSASKSELESINLRLEKSLSDLSGLYTVLGPLSQAVSAHAMLDGIIERLIQATGADAALVRVRDNFTGTFMLATQRGFPDFYLETTAVTDASSAVVRVFETDEPIIAADIASDPRLTGKVQLKVGLRSCAFLPLKVRNEIRGIVHLASRELGYFHEGRRDYLLAIARQMSIALENQEFFEKLKTSNVELERALGVKSQFLSVMSHELRTPLSVVGGYAAMIKDGMMGAVNPQQEAALQKVLNQTAEQLNMINDIMQTTQLESDSIVVERYPVNLSEFLDHLKSDYDFTFDKEGVTLIWDYPSEPATVVTDGGKLRQILHNLINNAIKFTDKGTVTVSARVTKGIRQEAEGRSEEENQEGRTEAETAETSAFCLLPPASGRWVELRVTDTGVGIPENKLEAVFDKFYQVDSSETRLYGGVGLGLYIVKNFTALLGGQIEVKSEPGKGSTFTVLIPCESVV